MARVWLLSCHLLTWANVVLTLEPSQIKVYPEDGRVAGVFQVSFVNAQNKMDYGFNASHARVVCQSLNVFMASQAQVEEALRNGLETCRFGWIDEQIAVIPRIKPSNACGRNKVGVVIWKAAPSKLFDVFCFDPSVEQLATTIQVPTTSKTTTGVPTIPTATPTVPFLLQSTQLVPSTSLPLSHSTSTSISPSPSSSFSLSFSSSRSPSSPRSLTSSTSRMPPSSTPHTLTSSTSHSPTVSPTHTPSSSSSRPLPPLTPRPLTPSSATAPPIPTQASTLHTDEHVEPQLTSPTEPSIGALPIAFLVLAVILLLLAAIAALWYYKTNRTRFSFWRRGRHKGDVETEVWEHFCKKDLKEQPAGIEMNGSRKNSGDMSLNEEPETKTDSS